MLSIGRAGTSCVDATIVRNVVRLLAAALGGAFLAGCAQSSVVTRTSEAPASRQASSSRKPAPFASTAANGAAHGLASFYTEGTRTASGEKFDTNQLTAAHPTLPFGTRLRVTNAATGQSVTVRVNDRGPYVAGRIVDVSYAAAASLGMVDGGLAKVKLDVVH